MKTAILYYSKHHGNTKKVLDAIAKVWNVTLIDAAETEQVELSGYDRIGFASGIYFSKFHKSVLKLAESSLPQGKKVFFLYTCGAKKDTYTKALRELAKARKAQVLGEYGCLGYDTYGPFKLIGGLAKGHPDEKELADAVAFYEALR